MAHPVTPKELAVQLLNSQMPGYCFSGSTVCFSSGNKRKPVWWLEPANKKFSQNFFIVLANYDVELLVFFIPANTITDPHAVFYQRTNKDSAHIEISVNDPTLIDARKGSIAFAPFPLQRLPRKGA